MTLRVTFPAPLVVSLSLLGLTVWNATVKSNGNLHKFWAVLISSKVSLAHSLGEVEGRCWPGLTLSLIHHPCRYIIW